MTKILFTMRDVESVVNQEWAEFAELQSSAGGGQYYSANANVKPKPVNAGAQPKPVNAGAQPKPKPVLKQDKGFKGAMKQAGKSVGGFVTSTSKRGLKFLRRAAVRTKRVATVASLRTSRAIGNKVAGGLRAGSQMLRKAGQAAAKYPGRTGAIVAGGAAAAGGAAYLATRNKNNYSRRYSTTQFNTRRRYR